MEENCSTDVDVDVNSSVTTPTATATTPHPQTVKPTTASTTEAKAVVEQSIPNNKEKINKKKKSVSFYRKVKVRKISSHKRYTLEERESSWYTEDEYIQIKNDCCFVVKQMMKLEQSRRGKSSSSTTTSRGSRRTRRTTTYEEGSSDEQHVVYNYNNDDNEIDEIDDNADDDNTDVYTDVEYVDYEYDDESETDDIEDVWRLELDDYSQNQTIRGLEYKTPNRALYRQRKKKDVVWSLLEVQEHQLLAFAQQEDDEDDNYDYYYEFHDRLSNLLSQVYIACNWKCRLDARRRGLQDEKESRKSWESTFSVKYVIEYTDRLYLYIF